MRQALEDCLVYIPIVGSDLDGRQFSISTTGDCNCPWNSDTARCWNQVTRGWPKLELLRPGSSSGIVNINCGEQVWTDSGRSARRMMKSRRARRN